MVQNGLRSDGMISDFESTVSYLLLHDPVAKRKSSGDKSDHSSIFESSTEVSSPLVAPKTSTGNTGVYFRLYRNDEFYKLSEE